MRWALLALFGLLPTTAAAQPPVELQQALSGRFQLAQTQAESQERIDAALAHAVVSLNVALRPLAKILLRRQVQPCPGYQLRLTDVAFTTQCLGDGPFTRPLDNSGPPLHDEGEDYTVTLTVTDNAVRVHFVGPRGGQEDTYTADGQGGLSVSHRIFSSHLPNDLRWVYVYRQAE